MSEERKLFWPLTDEASLGSAPSTIRIVILNAIASEEQHSCNVAQLGQEALCSDCLQRMHGDNNER